MIVTDTGGEIRRLKDGLKREENLMSKIARIALASASLLAIVTPAYAQSAEQAPDANNVPGAEPNEAFAETDIVVQARRRDESAQDVPLVVNAVTSEELAKLNIREFAEIATAVPGLALSTSANGIGTQTTLRGVAYDVNVSGNNGTIEFYLNDAPTSSTILFQTLFDVGQIELLRGPQGTLRGRASPSGSMTITTRRPNLSEVGGYINVTGTTRNAINVNGAVGVPIIQDVLALRVAGVYEENDGNRVHSINNGVNPYVKTQGVRASLRFDPTDNLSFNASYTKSIRDARQFDQVESANIANSALPASPVLVRANQRLSVEVSPREFRQDFDVFNWQGELRFAGQRLNYVGSYNKQRYATADPIDKGAFFLNNPVGVFLGGIDPVTFVPQAAPTGLQFPAYAGLTNDTITIGTQETHELRLSSDERLFGILDYVVGGMLLKTHTTSNIVTRTPLFNVFSAVDPRIPAGVVLPTLLNTSGTQRPGGTEEKSVFFNLTAHLGERTELSGGLRYIHYKETAALFVDQAGAGVFVDQPIGRRPLPGEQPEENVIWSASAKHRFTDNFMAYFSFGTSWRPGSTTNPIIAQFSRVPLVAPLDQFVNIPAEKSQSYEVGFKSDWLDRRLRFNATAYLQNFQNYAYQAANIIAVTGPTSVATLAPGLTAGVPVQVKGIEAELAWNTPRFSASAAITYSDSQIKNGTIPCNSYPNMAGSTPTAAEILAATNGGIFALCNVNYSASNLAPLSATLQAEYNASVSSQVDGYVRGLASVFGNSENNPSNAFDEVPSYALVNLYAGIRDPEGVWDVGVFVKNVFNVERVLSRNENAYAPSYQNFLGTTGVSTYRGISMTPPREFGLNVRYSFGSR